MSQIKKPESPAACRHWGGNRRLREGGPLRVAVCDHPMLWRKYSGRTCAEICGAGACPFGRELEARG